MSAERDKGLDKTDQAEERRLIERQLHVQTLMPFYESEPDVPYYPRQEKDED
jgi:hypothetical protein